MIDASTELLKNLLDELQKLESADKYEFIVSNAQIQSVSKEELKEILKNA
jgi:hypothetical protein